MSYKDDPVIVTASGYAVPRTSWALVRNGVIAAVVRTNNPTASPFDGVSVSGGRLPVDLTGETAIRVTGTCAMVGHLVDSHGNVTPSEGRTSPLMPRQAAYHDLAGTSFAARASAKAHDERLMDDAATQDEQAQGSENGNEDRQ